MMIKKIIRRNLPETNSSSSHSLVISTGPERYTGMNGKTISVDSDYFGSEGERVNSLIRKINYAIGLNICYYSPVPDNLKVIEKVRDIVEKEYKNHLDFEYLHDYFKELLKGDGFEGLYLEDYLPNVDHQSRDLIKEVWENDETLRNFLINPMSEVYLDSDCDETTDILVNSDLENFDIILTYPLGGDIGNVDFMIPNINFDDKITRTILEKEMGEVFFNIVFKDGKFTSRLSNMNSKDILHYTPPYGSVNYWIAEWSEGGNIISVKPTAKSKEFGDLCI